MNENYTRCVSMNERGEKKKSPLNDSFSFFSPLSFSSFPASERIAERFTSSFLGKHLGYLFFPSLSFSWINIYRSTSFFSRFSLSLSLSRKWTQEKSIYIRVWKLEKSRYTLYKFVTHTTSTKKLGSGVEEQDEELLRIIGCSVSVR